MTDQQMFNFVSYTKQPTTVKALELTEELWHKIFSYSNHVTRIQGRQICATKDKNRKYFLINSQEGLLHGDMHDMLINETKDYLYISKPKDFEKMYRRN